jgi:polar amino acid transport system substrate-binding protein
MKLGILILLALGQLSIAAQGKEVRIAFTKSMPPYLYENDNRGIELEIIRAAFKSQGINLAPYDNIHYVRASKLLKRKRIDAVVSNLNNQSYKNESTEIFDSTSTLSYMDCAISLAGKKFDYKNMSTFEKNTIWAFKSAKEVLGPDFKKAVLQNPNYTENYEQKNMIHMLVKKRVDIVISDRNIFSKTMLDSIGNKPHLFQFKKLIPKTPRNLKFHDKTLRDKFNKGLKQIKKNGTYNEIIKKYKDLYKSNC